MFNPIAYINEPRWQKVSLGLDRITLLLRLLGNPQDDLKFVHVAGTNGKGSVCAYLESILRRAGYKTGLFTSPYIDHFEERIRVNNEEIDIGSLTNITLSVKEKAEQVEEQLGEHPTEFELMTAVAFVYFFQQKCDICVVEVGLGGRLDSTNVITPVISVITKIGLDHTAILGDTIVKIANEKAGIIKAGVPVVVDEQTDEARLAIEKVANERNSEIIHVDKAGLRKGKITLYVEQNGMYVRTSDYLSQDAADLILKKSLTNSTNFSASSALSDFSRPSYVHDLPNERRSKPDADGEECYRFSFNSYDSISAFRSFSYKGKIYDTKLLGAYQPENAAVAIETALALGMGEKEIKAGIESATWPGRFEFFSSGLPCPVFVDGAHNPDGAAALRESLLDVKEALQNKPFCQLEQNFQSMSDLNFDTLKNTSDFTDDDFQSMSDLPENDSQLMPDLNVDKRKTKSEFKNRDLQCMSDFQAEPSTSDQNCKSDINLKCVKIIAVMGVLKDKDVRGILQNVGDLIDEFYVYEPNNPRKLTADELAALTSEYAMTHKEANAREALDAALKYAAIEATKKDSQSLVVCFGSLYSVGELRAHLKEFAR